MKKHFPPTRCGLCNDTGFVTVFMRSSVDAFCRGEYDDKAHRVGCAIACCCRAGESKVGDPAKNGRERFKPSEHCEFDRTWKPEEARAILAEWCDEHRQPTVTQTNGVETWEFR